MAEAQYFADFAFAADIDPAEDWQPWRQAMPHIKALVGLCIVSAVLAIAYPLSFAEIFNRL